MDFIGDSTEYIKNKIKNVSLKDSLSFYIFIAVISVIICYSITLQICNDWETLVQAKYDDENAVISYNSDNLVITKQNIEDIKYNRLSIIQFLRYFTILSYSIIAVVITTHLYYNNKLKEPLNLLKKEAEAIGRQDLSFVCYYNSKDEMGEICDTFNKMRLKLIDNEKVIWRLMDEQRQINAAFAHDLRTPLTVMKGYIELINNYYPSKRLTEEKLIETLGTLKEQVTRLEKFSTTMKNIHSFERMEAVRKKHKFEECLMKLKESTNGMKEIQRIKPILNFENELLDKEVYLDDLFVIEVYENILTNAFRFAKKHIEVNIEIDDDILYIYLKDDGEGFLSMELYHADKPYYTRNKDSMEHFGLGLTISRILCEKHGGTIQLSNSINGGAIVCASFSIE